MRILVGKEGFVIVGENISVKTRVEFKNRIYRS